MKGPTCRFIGEDEFPLNWSMKRAFLRTPAHVKRCVFAWVSVPFRRGCPSFFSGAWVRA